jgi:hypothetical protein
LLTLHLKSNKRKKKKKYFLINTNRGRIEEYKRLRDLRVAIYNYIDDEKFENDDEVMGTHIYRVISGNEIEIKTRVNKYGFISFAGFKNKAK